MGNLIASLGSIGVPLFHHLVTIPYLYHPHRWGGIPWVAPGILQLSIVTVLLNIVSMIILGTISGIMTTKQKCNKSSLIKSIINSVWVVAALLIGNGFMSIFGSIKGPFLVWLKWMPYSSWVVQGIMVSLVVLLFGSIGNTLLRKSVCPEEAFVPDA